MISFAVNAPLQSRVWNTGVTGPNAANFTLIQAPGGITVPTAAVPTTVAGGWLPNTAASAWVSYRPNSSGFPGGIHVYRQTFDLPCTNGASIVGRFAADDTARIFLNGQPTPAYSPGFSAWTSVNLNTGLSVGGNTLEIVVTNAIIWTDIRAELTNFFTCCCPASVVLRCPPAVTACVCGTNTTTQVNYQVTASSLCGNPIVSLVCVPPSGSTFPLGTTWVTCTATDSLGNRNTCSFPVTVSRDTTPTVIGCPGNIVRYV